jgi:hypothetical protein
VQGKACRPANNGEKRSIHRVSAGLCMRLVARKGCLQVSQTRLPASSGSQIPPALPDVDFRLQVHADQVLQRQAEPELAALLAVGG